MAATSDTVGTGGFATDPVRQPPAATCHRYADVRGRAAALSPGVEQRYFDTAVSHRGTTVFVHLLPYMEQSVLEQLWNNTDPLQNATSLTDPRAATVVPAPVCPSDEISENPVAVPMRDWRYALTSYGGNGGTRSYFPARATTDGMFHTTGEASEPEQHQRPVAAKQVTGGLSHTMLFGERAHTDTNYDTFATSGWAEPLAQWGWWAASGSRKMIGHVTMSTVVPINYRLPFAFSEGPSAVSFADLSHNAELRLCAYGSNHPGGANFAFADGSLRFLASDTEELILRALSTRAGDDQ